MSQSVCVGYACRQVPVLVLSTGTPWLAFRELYYHLVHYTVSYNHSHLDMPNGSTSRPVDELAVDSDSDDETQVTRRKTGRLTRGPGLAIPERVIPTTSGLQSPLSFHGSALFASVPAHSSSFPDIHVLKAHERIQAGELKRQEQRVKAEAAAREASSSSDTSPEKDLATREYIRRRRLSPTERYYDKMSHALKRKVVIMGAPSVGESPPLRFRTSLTSYRQDILDTTIRRSPNIPRTVLPHRRGYLPQDHHPRWTRVRL